MQVSLVKGMTHSFWCDHTSKFHTAGILYVRDSTPLPLEVGGRVDIEVDGQSVGTRGAHVRENIDVSTAWVQSSPPPPHSQGSPRQGWSQAKTLPPLISCKSTEHGQTAMLIIQTWQACWYLCYIYPLARRHSPHHHRPFSVGGFRFPWRSFNQHHNSNYRMWTTVWITTLAVVWPARSTPPLLLIMLRVIVQGELHKECCKSC